MASSEKKSSGTTDDKPEKNKSGGAGGVGSREAILHGPLLKTWLSVSWPLVGAFMLQIFERNIGVFWVGRLVGTGGLEALALFWPFMFFIQILLSVVSSGLRPLIAQSVAREDGEAPSMMISCSYLLLVITITFALFGMLNLDWLADQLAGQSAASPELKRILFAFLLFVSIPPVAQILDVAIASTGWTQFGLIRNAVAICFGLVLLPLFIVYGDLGAAGVSWSEGTADVLLMALTATTLYRYRNRLGIGQFTKKAFKPRFDLLRRIFAIGLGPNMSRMVAVVGQIASMQYLTWDGPAAVAGFLLCLVAIDIVAQLLGAVIIGSSIMISQNAAANHTTRARQLVAYTIITSVAGCALFYVLHLVGLISWLLSLVVQDDPTVVTIANRFMIFLGIALPVSMIGRVFMASFAAVGNTRLAGILDTAVALISIAVLVLYPGDATTAVMASWIAYNAGRTLVLGALYPTAFLGMLAQGPPQTRR